VLRYLKDAVKTSKHFFPVHVMHNLKVSMKSKMVDYLNIKSEADLEVRQTTA